ncbi:hypothetical protein CFP56_009639 [Quercus suber]|uniref:Uncharacterized protein n=1 Tax=Quercus suber TaxID=58331 RepID=A0AAW0M4U2_QUESU
MGGATITNSCVLSRCFRLRSKPKSQSPSPSPSSSSSSSLPPQSALLDHDPLPKSLLDLSRRSIFNTNASFLSFSWTRYVSPRCSYRQRTGYTSIDICD